MPSLRICTPFLGVFLAKGLVSLTLEYDGQVGSLIHPQKSEGIAFNLLCLNESSIAHIVPLCLMNKVT